MATEPEKRNGVPSQNPLLEHTMGDAWYQHIQFGRSSSEEIFGAYRNSTQFQEILTRYQEELAENKGELSPEKWKKIKNELKREVFTDIALGYLMQIYPKVRPGEYIEALLPREQDGQQTERRGSLAERDKIHDVIGATIHEGDEERVKHVVMFVAEDTSHIRTVATLGALRMMKMMKQSSEIFAQDALLLVFIPDGGKFDTTLGFPYKVVRGISVRDIGDFVRKGIVESSQVVSKGRADKEGVRMMPNDQPKTEEGEEDLDHEIRDLLAFVRAANLERDNGDHNKRKRR